MAWVKLDDQYFFHPKIILAGRDARDLHLAGLAYCAGQLTNGRIDRESLLLLGAMSMIPPAVLHASAERLVEVGLWEETENGWQVHDYLEYNPTRETVTTKRAESRERMRNLRGLRSPDVRANNERTTSEVQRLPSPSPSPSPDPIPAAAAPELRPEPNADPVVAHLFTLLDKAAVFVNGMMQAEAWTDLLDITRDKALLSETFVEAARTGKHPSPNWCRSVLERCIRDNTRPGKWNGDGRGRDEPAGKPYARDGPLRKIFVEDSQGNITEETIG